MFKPDLTKAQLRDVIDGMTESSVKNPDSPDF